MCLNVCPWPLLIVIANAGLIGSCRRRKEIVVWMSASVSSGIRGMKAVWPAWDPVMIFPMTMRSSRWVTIKRVPFTKPLRVFKLRRRMMGLPTLSVKRCGGNPTGSSIFKNSVGYSNESCIVASSIE